MLSITSKSSSRIALLTLVALSSLSTVVEAALSYSGCYSSSSGLKEYATWKYQTSGWCYDHCITSNSAVIGLTAGNDCWCGNSLPPANSKVDDSKCSTTCDGYTEMCGGTGFFTVYTTGVKDISNNGLSSPSPSSSSATQTSSSSQRVVTSIAPGQTIVVTLPPSATPPKKSGPNTAGIAAGVVVGIVGAGALCGGLYFYLRRRKQRIAEEEYRRNNQMSQFMRGTSEIKHPDSIYSGASDARLDPVAGRRDSCGSLADAQDYSRRILRIESPQVMTATTPNSTTTAYDMI